jgi:general secretion pathway protein D
VKEISSPKTVTLDNEKATIEVGELYPIVNTSAGTANTTGGSQITYSNLTVKLEVTPRISANDFVNLSVMPSITKLGSPVVSKVGGVDNVVDSFLTRLMTTHVMVPSGNTLVMGGLIQDQINQGNTKVPLLGDIPVLGYLFRSDSKARNKTDLILFITPTIVADHDYQPTKSDYLKTPVPKKDYLEGDWSAWDSGKPKDWSQDAAKGNFQSTDSMLKQNNATASVAEAGSSTK